MLFSTFDLIILFYSVLLFHDCRVEFQRPADKTDEIWLIWIIWGWTQAEFDIITKRLCDTFSPFMSTGLCSELDFLYMRHNNEVRDHNDSVLWRKHETSSVGNVSHITNLELCASCCITLSHYRLLHLRQPAASICWISLKYFNFREICSVSLSFPAQHNISTETYKVPGCILYIDSNVVLTNFKFRNLEGTRNV